MKIIKPAISIVAFSLLSACATKSNGVTSSMQDNRSAMHRSSSNNNVGGGTYTTMQSGTSVDANSNQINGSVSNSQSRTLQQSGAVSLTKMRNGTSVDANSNQINGSVSNSQSRTLQQSGAVSPTKNSSASRPSPLGTWSGSDNQERVTIKFGANGSLILNNAAGANSGKWDSTVNGTFRISIGGSDGEFTMIDASTASFTSGGSSIELKRN